MGNIGRQLALVSEVFKSRCMAVILVIQYGCNLFISLCLSFIYHPIRTASLLSILNCYDLYTNEKNCFQTCCLQGFI